CLITANHDVCVRNYVNAMNFHVDNQNAKVLNTANQKKHKTKVKNSKRLGSKERLALPKLGKPRLCFRWSPTGRIFDCGEKLIESSDDVNDAMGFKKKPIMVTSDPWALLAEKTKVSKSKEKVVVSSDSEGSSSDDFNFVKTGDKKKDKKANEKIRDMSKVKCYNCKKEGHFAKDCKKAKVKDYEYYKTKMLLAKKDKDEQVLLAENQAWMELSSDSDQEINANMVFMAQIEKVLSDSEASSLRSMGKQPRGQEF
nr:hypothetical protein [Tanacetum cinerariifolium]